MRKLVIDMKKRWAKGLITGLVMIFIILTIVFIVKSVRDSKIEIRCPDTIVVELEVILMNQLLRQQLRNIYLMRRTKQILKSKEM